MSDGKPSTPASDVSDAGASGSEESTETLGGATTEGGPAGASRPASDASASDASDAHPPADSAPQTAYAAPATPETAPDPYSTPAHPTHNPYAAESAPQVSSGSSYGGPQQYPQPPAGGAGAGGNPWAAPGSGSPNYPGGPFATGEPAYPDKPGKPGWRASRVLVGAFLLALIAGGVGGLGGAYLQRHRDDSGVTLEQSSAGSSKRSKHSVAGIAQRALPGVVYIHVKGAGSEGTGTGFILDKEGHIMTNNHVATGAGKDAKISVTFNDGQQISAKVVGNDSGYDLAVLKVDGVKGLHPLPLGNSKNVQVGDPVVAIGAPYDLAGTVTSGIISAKDRPVTAGGERGNASDISYANALQTDAAINPGNSGGPLVDAQGQVIGINSSIRTASSGSGPQSGGEQGGSIGLGFAIPVDQAKRVSEQLIKKGHAVHPVIGVVVDMRYSGDGAKVIEEKAGGKEPVTPDGPGDEAGIKPGDVITKVDGQRVHRGDELIVKVRSKAPGEKLKLTLTRHGKEHQVTLTLGGSSSQS